MLAHFIDKAVNPIKDKLLVIDISDLSAKEMNIGEFVNVSGCLESGRLILCGKTLSVWRTDKWPFELIKCVKRPERVFKLVALPCFLFCQRL